MYCTTQSESEPLCNSCHNGCGCLVAFTINPSLGSFRMFPVNSDPAPLLPPDTCQDMCLSFSEERFDRTACLMGLLAVTGSPPAFLAANTLSAEQLGQECAAFCSLRASFDHNCTLTCTPGARCAHPSTRLGGSGMSLCVDAVAMSIPAF